MRIGVIPGALDTLSGDHFPHFIHMQENVKALRKKCQIVILTADKASAMYMKFKRSRLYEMLNHRALHMMRKLIHFLFFLVVYGEVRKKVTRQQNDLFLIRFSFSNYLISQYLYSRGQKILLEVHALAHVEEQRYGQSYAPPFYFLLIAYLEKRMLGWAHKMTAVSESLKSSLVSLGVHQHTIHVIHNAADLDTFDYRVNPRTIIEQYGFENKIVIGFVGSLARYHGVPMLLDVVENLEKKYVNLNVLIVGRNVHGSDNVVEEVASRKLSHLFRFTGEVAHSRIPLYIAAMDVAIIPDFNTYGSPMKLFEYMAMGKAVVAPDLPSIREVVRNGQTVILFEKGNVAELSEAIERLIENDQLRYGLGRRANRIVVESHNWDRNAEEIVRIAKHIIRSNLTQV